MLQENGYICKNRRTFSNKKKKMINKYNFTTNTFLVRFISKKKKNLNCGKKSFRLIRNFKTGQTHLASPLQGLPFIDPIRFTFLI